MYEMTYSDGDTEEAGELEMELNAHFMEFIDRIDDYFKEGRLLKLKEKWGKQREKRDENTQESEFAYFNLGGK